MIIGMDFGTTNSGMAMYDGKQVRLVPLDPANRNPNVARTAVYIGNDQTIHIGRQAVDTYFEHNIGRPVKMQKVWVGELEIFGADMYFVTDAYEWVDVMSPGRLFLSIKTSLRDAAYAGTVVGQYFYSLEDLITLYLSVTKLRAERELGQELTQVVLGRPVRFAFEPEKDKLAQDRLLQAAFNAGYEEVYLQAEPIAAAYSYATTLTKPENVLVFDFGGGTLDITVMRLGPTERQVLATGGIPVAGDVFDQRIVQSKLTPHFGRGSMFGPRHKSLAVPDWLFDLFSDWQTILQLQSHDNQRLLKEIAQTARRKFQIEALQSLVSSNYGLKMFDIVEQAKRRISDKRGSEILLEGDGFKVREFITRTEFERIIRAEIVAVQEHLQETLAKSGLKAEQVDVVIRTGGSSQIAVFHEMLCKTFGREKVRSLDTFSSVTSGLGVIGHEIEAGLQTLPLHTKKELHARQETRQSKPNVSPANLDVLQRRIRMGDGFVLAELDEDWGFVAVDEVGAVSVITGRLRGQDLSGLGLPSPLVCLVHGKIDDTILLITNKYRFLLMTPRELLELQEMDLTLNDVHQLEAREEVCMAVWWEPLKQAERMLFVTSGGEARPYPTAVLSSRIEAAVPLKFDHALNGVPVAVLPAKKTDEVALLSRKGRGVRWPMNRLKVSGTKAFNCGKDDRVMAAALCRDLLWLGCADGNGRYLYPITFPEAEKTNTRGKSMVSRRTDAVALSLEPEWVVTSKRILPLPELEPDDSNKTYPFYDALPTETLQLLL